MPAKKKTSAGKRKQVQLQQRASVATNIKKAPSDIAKKRSNMLETLKENNKCLASALDESRKQCHKLQLENLTLQQERQELMEKISSLEAKQRRRDKEFLHIHSALVLLKEAEKDVSLLKKHLNLLLHQTDTATGPGLTRPSLLSPITEPDNQVQFAPFISIATSSPNPSNKAVFRTTPYPKLPLKSHPHFSSTPYPNALAKSSLNLTPCGAIDFEEHCAIPTSAKHGGDEQEDTGIASPVQVSQAENEKSPDLPSAEERRGDHMDGNDTFDDLEEHLVRVQVSQRPRRKCTTLCISYQEPSLNRKLRRGDPFTDSSMNMDSTRTKPSIKHTVDNKSNPRVTLQNVTNKK